MKNGKFAKRGVATKAMVMILSLMLVIGLSVGGTIAWLTAETGTVENTFTVGNIIIELWENDFVLSTNSLNTAKKVTAENEYKVVPGGKSPKNPTVTVKAGSEECYVYVTVENNLLLDNNTAVATLTYATGWTEVKVEGTKTLYRYNTTVNLVNATEDKDVPVFTHVTYADEAITKDNIGQLNGDKIIIKAYAHQAANTTQTVADSAATAWAFN